MNKKHLLFVIILSLLYYYFINLFVNVFISLSLVSFLCTITGVVKSRNCSKSANYLAIGFAAAIISLFTDVRFLADNSISVEILLTGFLTVFCGMMCYMIFVDETDNYRLNLKYSKIKLFSFTGIILALYLVIFF
ncbi:MAG: hypothetical protein R6W90_00335 [Ignavibacteriaceae bacterium]